MPRRALRSYPTNYATDLTDEQWAAIAPLVITPSPNGGRPTEIDRRAIVNALLYKNRTGCQWRMLPKDFPPMSSVRSYFDKWNRDGTYYTTMPAPPASFRVARRCLAAQPRSEYRCRGAAG